MVESLNSNSIIGLIITAALFNLNFVTSASNQLSKEHVKATEKERYEAIIAADTSALSVMLAEEFIYHQPTGVVASKQQYLENTAAGNPAIISANFTALNVNIYNDFAVSRGMVSIEARMGGDKITADLLFLNVWILRDGQLKLTARQSAFRDASDGS
jgi:hypothetical protein